ncbi:MAG: RidA family protein, partial [Pseudomonadota bacterium]
QVDQKLAELGYTLPDAPKPVGAYAPYFVADKLVFVSGQICFGPDGLIVGKVGAAVDLAKARQAAQLCALNLLTQARAACDGDLDRIKACVKLTGFVNCTPDFTDQPKVIDAASEVMLAVFGESGRHARAAVGAPSLPLGAAVEIDAIFALR